MRTRYFMSRFLVKCISCLLFMMMAGLIASAQVILSNDQLISNAFSAYNSGDYLNSSIYLYAYLQRNPAELLAQPDVAASVKASCTYSFSQLSGRLDPSLAININPALLGNNDLFNNSNQAIQSSNWSNAAIYTFAYLQRMGASGYDTQGLSNSYADLKGNLDQAINDFSPPSPSDSGNRIIDHRHRTIPRLILPASALAVQGPVKKSSNIRFRSFDDAFRFVLGESANSFENIKGPPFSNNTALIKNFKPLMTIENGSVVASNIFKTNHSWAFRFVISGGAVDEPNQFDRLCGQIEQVLESERIKYSKVLYSYRSGTPPAFAYTVHGRRIEITRTISGYDFSDEVIVYSLQ